MSDIEKILVRVVRILYVVAVIGISYAIQTLYLPALLIILVIAFMYTLSIYSSTKGTKLFSENYSKFDTFGYALLGSTVVVGGFLFIWMAVDLAFLT